MLSQVPPPPGGPGAAPRGWQQLQVGLALEEVLDCFAAINSQPYNQAAPAPPSAVQPMPPSPLAAPSAAAAHRALAPASAPTAAAACPSPEPTQLASAVGAAAGGQASPPAAAAAFSLTSSCNDALQQLFAPPTSLPPQFMDTHTLQHPAVDATGMGWLSDIQVHNLGCLSARNAGGMGRAAAAVVRSPVEPSHLLTHLSDARFGGRSGWRTAAQGGGSVVQALVVAGHFTAVALDGPGKRAYLFDPRLVGGGFASSWVADVTAALRALDPAIEVSVWPVSLQRDSHQCGVWAAFYIAMWLAWLMTMSAGGCFHSWLQRRLQQDGAVPDDTPAAQAYIQRFRHAAAALHNAAAACPSVIPPPDIASPPAPRPTAVPGDLSQPQRQKPGALATTIAMKSGRYQNPVQLPHWKELLMPLIEYMS